MANRNLARHRSVECEYLSQSRPDQIPVMSRSRLSHVPVNPGHTLVTSRFLAPLPGSQRRDPRRLSESLSESLSELLSELLSKSLSESL